MNKFEEEFNCLIKLFGNVLIRQIEVEEFEKHKEIFIKKYSEKRQPEIPEFVANHIEAAKEDFWTLLSAMDDSNVSSRVGDWLKGGNFSNQEIFAQAWINGYTVAKEKRFYLKNKLTGNFLMKWGDALSEDTVFTLQEEPSKGQFTQQEIDNMETGSYEQIEVEE